MTEKKGDGWDEEVFSSEVLNGSVALLRLRSADLFTPVESTDFRGRHRLIISLVPHLLFSEVTIMGGFQANGVILRVPFSIDNNTGISFSAWIAAPVTQLRYDRTASKGDTVNDFSSCERLGPFYNIQHFVSLPFPPLFFLPLPSFPSSRPCFRYVHRLRIIHIICSFIVRVLVRFGFVSYLGGDLWTMVP